MSEHQGGDGKGLSATVRPEARYANYFEIGHNAFEFIFDFGQYHPESRTAQMQCRIVTGPVYAKLLAEMFQASIARFEQEYGPIEAAKDDMDPLEIVRSSLADSARHPAEIVSRFTSLSRPRPRE
jgi:hypothetical protein